MLNILEYISPWLALVAFLSLFSVMISFLILVIQKARSQPFSNKYVTSLKISLLIFVSFMIINSFMSFFIMNKIQNIIESHKFSILIENEKYLDKEKFSEDFSNMHTFKKYSGSHPVETISVKFLTQEEELNLHFKRDSRDQNFYWIYFPSFKFHPVLGYVKTNILSDFPKR